MTLKLEICTDSLASAIIAEQCGADRIELCAGLAEGGVSPSQGTLSSVVKKLSIPVNVLIRPRPGNFHYDPDETESMLKDIAFCKNNGVAGIVTGALHPDGRIDKDLSEKLLEASYPMDSTFHRAFDVTPDPLNALEEIIQMGYRRILTSGQMMSAFEGRFNIADYVKAANDRICIMPGAGISEDNLRELYKCTRATEYHMALRKEVSKEHCLESLSMNSTLFFLSGERLKEVVKIIRSLP